MKIVISTSEKLTRSLASKLARKSRAPQCFCLSGDLGSGKTVFCKGFAEGLGIAAKQIKSPTFTLMRKYKKGRKVLYHCDFYRINEPDDLLAADLEEIFQQKNAIVLIEWPERVKELLPKNCTNITLEYQDPSTRIITFEHD